jgi:hypothetical protein
VNSPASETQTNVFLIADTAIFLRGFLALKSINVKAVTVSMVNGGVDLTGGMACTVIRLYALSMYVQDLLKLKFSRVSNQKFLTHGLLAAAAVVC